MCLTHEDKSIAFYICFLRFSVCFWEPKPNWNTLSVDMGWESFALEQLASEGRRLFSRSFSSCWSASPNMLTSHYMRSLFVYFFILRKPYKIVISFFLLPGFRTSFPFLMIEKEAEIIFFSNNVEIFFKKRHSEIHSRNSTVPSVTVEGSTMRISSLHRQFLDKMKILRGNYS